MGKSRKTPAPRPQSRPNEIYLTRSKPVSVYQNRVRKLVTEGYSEVILHGLGMAIPATVALAAALQSEFASIDLQTNTVQVIDEGEQASRKLRPVSALHVRLVKD